MKKLILLLLMTGILYAQAQQAYVTEKDIRYYADSVNKRDTYIGSQCTLDIYYPKGATNYATIVWFHGGGFTGGNKSIPKALMDKGYAIVSVEYRFSPKAPAPAYIEDAAAAVAWVFQHIGHYGGSTGLIFLSGHSAGGYLDMMITLDKKYLKKYNIDANSIAGIIPFSGQAITHFTVRKEQGIKDTQPTIDQYAPLYHVRADAPPMLLITGDREMELLGRYEENAYLNRMMKLAGNKDTRLYELDGFGHGNMPEGAFPLLLNEVAALIKKKDGKK
ncbi:alpha/beta hydrolase [Paraflavitalea soli]|uniref:Alpha/beta hydrolase n=1 Tax=Paraflavitalea soli TaxID=2315862 RepID=A0A3B7MRS8_9BACT|nr:alpha/beta hydrolase fold domain-containing protein [Paraflavitalea soli]AXY76009.1 alpha/beta hydrolase [Paraflavitalea soli]